MPPHEPATYPRVRQRVPEVSHIYTATFPRKRPSPPIASVRGASYGGTNMCSLHPPIPPHPAVSPPPPDRAAPRPLPDLEREICELAAHIAAATCRWLLLVAEWDERAGWAEWGVNSCAEWLGWRCSIGAGTAREHVRVARRLMELPLVREAFGSGELSYSKVRAVTRIAAPETEAQLVELARHATGAQVERVVRKYRGALAATLGVTQRAHEGRYLRWYWDDDGSLMLRARIPADEGALVLAALEGTESPAESLADPAPLADQRDADGLVAVARAALAAAPGERAGGDPCEMIVHVDVETLAGDEVHERSEIETAPGVPGPALAPETLRRLGCDAAVVRIVERDGRPLSVGRRRAHGGATEIDNLVQLCSRHHRLVHEGGYRVERAGRRGSIRFRRPDGHEVPASCPAVRPAGAGLVRQNAARGLAIDDDTCRAKSAGDPLDYSIAVEGLLREVLGPG